MEKYVEELQDILPLVRGAMGWSAEDLGERIGVKRQTIYNIEKGKTELSKTQYIAIRSVIDAELKRFDESATEKSAKKIDNSGAEMVLFLLDAFIDNRNDYSDTQREQMKQKANLLIPAILKEPSKRKEASDEWVKALGLIAGAVGIAGMTGLTASWIIRAIRSK